MAVDLQVAAQHQHTLAHAHQAEGTAASGAGVEAPAVIADAQAEHAVFLAQANGHSMRLGMAHDIGQGFLQYAEQPDRLGVGQLRQLLRHFHQAGNLGARFEAPGLPLDGRGDAGVEDRRAQGGGHVAHQLEQLGDQALHAFQALAQAGIEAGEGQLAHGGFQLEHGEHLAQFVVHLAGDARLLFLAHAFQVRRQLAQLGARGLQLQLDLLVPGDVPDHAIPDRPAILEDPRAGLDVGPAQLPIASEDAPLPVPIAVGAQRRLLAGPVTVTVLRVDQAADAAPGVEQFTGAIAHEALAALADEGEVGGCPGPGPLQAEYQAGHVGGDALEAGFALLQGLAGAAPLGGIGKKDHQVLRRAETQKAQGYIGRQPAAVRTQAAGLEAQRTFVAVARAAPEVEPAIHAQLRLEVRQGPVRQAARCVAEHLFGGAVGVAHMAVPVDPEDAQGAVVDGELGEAQGFLGRLAQLQGVARVQQLPLQATALAAQPGDDGGGGQQQRPQQQAEVLPEAGGFAQARVLGLQPALVELVQVLGRQAAQGDIDDAGQFRPVTPGGNPQQLRKADVPDDRQPGELLLAGQAAELGFVQHRIAHLLGEQRLQGLALAGHGLQVEVGIGGAQVIGYRTGLAQGNG
ncbi:hypothetical protein D3C84_319580 [compost metagenome]